MPLYYGAVHQVIKEREWAFRNGVVRLSSQGLVSADLADFLGKADADFLGKADAGFLGKVDAEPSKTKSAVSVIADGH